MRLITAIIPGKSYAGQTIITAERRSGVCRLKDLRNIAIVIALAVVSLTQLAVLLLSLSHEQKEHASLNGAQVELAARIAGETYVTRRTQNAQLAQRLAADDSIRKQTFRGSIQDMERRLSVLAPLSQNEFVAVLNSENRLQSLSLAPDSILNPELIKTSLNEQPYPEGSGLIRVDQAILSVHSTGFDIRGSRFSVVTGFSPEEALSRRINAALKDTVIVNISENAAAPDAGVISLPLDSFGDLTLTVRLQLQSQTFGLTHPTFLKFVGQSVFILSMAGLLCALLFTRLFVRRVDEPVKLIRRAIRVIKEGRLQEPVNLKLASPYQNISHDLEAMREALCDREIRIMHHAEYDALTGLTNRSVIAEKLKLALSRGERKGTIVSALAIDLSRFSEINGSMGHEVGDEVLKEIARRLASNARVTDTVARVGGDEFFVILEDDDIKLAQSLAKFMVSNLMSAIHVNGSEIKLSVHAGVAFFPRHCDSAEALRRMANIALYTAKEHGKPLVIYEPGQDEKHLRELAIIHDLPNAIKNNELYLQYQPKIDMETQQVKQVEALVRWRHPQLGFIPPDEFIALLEKSGMIGRLTDWVFKEAIRQARAWMDAGYDLGIAVNISANDLADEKLAERLKLLLHHYLVDASRITIEVTESAVIKDPENSVKVLNELRSAGVRCALDDFGTGQTSLALLKQLPISELKIDKSFVQNLRADSGDAIIVKSIIDLGHNMGLHVTAEGVESNYCWNLLNSYGCNLIQGYLVSAPLTADELAEWHLRLQDRHMNKLDLSFVHDMTA